MADSQQFREDAEKRYQEALMRLQTISQQRQKQMEQMQQQSLSMAQDETKRGMRQADAQNQSWAGSALTGANIGMLAGPQGAGIGAAIGGGLGLIKSTNYRHHKKHEGYGEAFLKSLFNIDAQLKTLDPNSVASLVSSYQNQKARAGARTNPAQQPAAPVPFDPKGVNMRPSIGSSGAAMPQPDYDAAGHSEAGSWHPNPAAGSGAGGLNGVFDNAFAEDSASPWGRKEKLK